MAFEFAGCTLELAIHVAECDEVHEGVPRSS